MKENKICCGFVLFNPKSEDIENIKHISLLFSRVFIVDNSSLKNNNFLDDTNIIYVSNGENKGLSIALNQICDLASKEGYEFCMLFDQDSNISEESLKKMLAIVDMNLNKSIAIYCPNIIYIGSNKKVLDEENKYIDWCITSGSIIDLEIFKKLNGFDNNYFIDRIDRDYCEKVKINGYKIYRIGEAKLYQNLGYLKAKNRSCHSPIRHYYIARNRLYYNKKFNITFFASLLQTLKHILSVICFEDKKKDKISMIIIGIKDFYRNKFGGFKKEK